MPVLETFQTATKKILSAFPFNQKYLVSISEMQNSILTQIFENFLPVAVSLFDASRTISDIFG